MYYYRVQTQLFVCSADYADFVVATFRDGDVNFSIQRIFWDEILIKEIVNKSSCFFELFILPELLVKWYSREEVMAVQTAVASTISDTYVYCYCKEDKGGEMVDCDNDDCESGPTSHALSWRIHHVPASGIVQTVARYLNLQERSKRNNVVNVIL